MKILIGLTRSDTAGSGAFIHIKQIGIAFRDAGNEVIYVLGGNGIACQKLASEGFRVITMPNLKRNLLPFYDILCLIELIWIIIKERPKLCSWHTAKIGALGRLAALVTWRRSYYVAHGVPFAKSEYNHGYKLYESLERILSALPTKIICVCGFDRDEYKRIGVAPKKLLTIPNGMKPAATTSPRLVNNHVLRFATAARFEAQKDYVTLSSACHALTKSGRNFELHIFGDGPGESLVRKSFGGLIGHKVLFRGVVDNFPDELAQSDVFLLSSRWEGLPRSIIEAMACAKPVIASMVGGVSELVDHKTTGFLVPPGDAHAFAEAMSFYIDTKSALVSHGDAALSKYKRHYTLEVMLDSYCKEYLGVVKSDEPTTVTNLRDLQS